LHWHVVPITLEPSSTSWWRIRRSKIIVKLIWLQSSAAWTLRRTWWRSRSWRWTSQRSFSKSQASILLLLFNQLIILSLDHVIHGNAGILKLHYSLSLCW